MKILIKLFTLKYLTQVTMIKSTPFIRTVLDNPKIDQWGIDEKKGCVVIQKIENIPVISCIGTSRDGKSTALNLYAKWIIENHDNKKTFFDNIKDIFRQPIKETPFNPFISAQSGDDVVTNGIDYLEIPNKCLLIDCQGMQLSSAKYDHYLMLITYLISNVIIFTVRERLDLQVLNNCLAVFSFLSEIPDEYRRNDKPILLIRIKDFQNSSALKKDPKFLEKIIDKWLTPTNDQYDQIKQAFKNTFEIKACATKHPQLNDNDEVDIYSKNFFTVHPDFLEFCKSIQNATNGKKAPKILSDPKNLEKLIAKLIENKKIDWRKLDLYHQITENELRKYVQDNLITCSLSDKTIVDKMNGSKESYDTYENRKIEIERMKNDIYDNKFKDITDDIKNSVFSSVFVSFNEIVNNAQKRNIELAESTILPHCDTFKQKYSDRTFNKCWVNKIMSYFDGYKKTFMTELEKIDVTVKEKYLLLINDDEQKAKTNQDLINKNNCNEINTIKSIIKNKNISSYISDQIYNFIHEQIDNEKGKYNYTLSFDQTVNHVKHNLNGLLKECTKNMIIYFMNRKGEIETKPLNTNITIEYDDIQGSFNVKITCNEYTGEIYIDSFNKFPYEKFFNQTKKSRLDSMIFMYFSNNDINNEDLGSDIVRVCIPNPSYTNNSNMCHCFTFTKNVYDALIKKQMDEYANQILYLFDEKIESDGNGWTTIRYTLKNNINNEYQEYNKYLMKKIFIFMGGLAVYKNVKMFSAFL